MQILPHGVALNSVVLRRMDRHDNEDRVEAWYECDSFPFVDQVSAYLTHRVSAEMFTLLTQNNFLHNIDYDQYFALETEVYHREWNRMFPRGDVPADPFDPVSPPPLVRAGRERRNISGRNRCASATLNNFRCTRHVLYPLTVCAVHAQYFLTHLCFPPGGTTCPHTPDVTDAQNNVLIDHTLPEMRRALTPPARLLISQINALAPPPNTLLDGTIFSGVNTPLTPQTQ